MYRLIDELGFEIDRGSKTKMQKSCAVNYGSQIINTSPMPVQVVGWQERINKKSILLVNRIDGSTVVFNPELHIIK
jgi:hypothetical protein